MPFTCSEPGSTASSVVEPTGLSAMPPVSPASHAVSAARSVSGVAPSDSVTAAGSVGADVPFCRLTETASSSPGRTMPFATGESVKSVSPGGTAGVGVGVGSG